MNSLGIYFGPKVISLVETKGKKVLNHVQISRLLLSTGELEEKVPGETKMVTLINDELRKNKIETKEANIALSGKDLIIRTFEIPAVLPKYELLQYAVNFEARKYIPFKVEDLISDFQLRFDKLNRRNLILFIGIKKETLDNYLIILNQLNIKVKAIEYAGFSILRFLKLSGLGNKGIVGIISADFQEEDEVNFMVLENGFPLFSRDIDLTGGPEEFIKTQESQWGINLDKLKTEIRISLDYYNRKLLIKNIKKILLISDKDSFLELGAFIKDMGLSAQFIDVSRYLDKSIPFSLSFVKGYNASLSKMIKTHLRIDLLAARSKVMLPQKTDIKLEATTLLADIRIEPKILIVAFIICVFAFAQGLYKQALLKNELNKVINMRPPVSTANPEVSYEELRGIDSNYKEKINTLNNLIRKQLYLTELLDAIVRIIPRGIWLTNFDLQKKEDEPRLTIEGKVYLADSNKELEMINEFLLSLKKAASFNKYFKNINIVSVDHEQIGDTTLTNFLISCQN